MKGVPAKAPSGVTLAKEVTLKVMRQAWAQLEKRNNAGHTQRSPCQRWKPLPRAAPAPAPVCPRPGLGGAGGRGVLSSPGWTQPLLREGWSHCLHAPHSISPQTCQKMRGINKPHPHCPPQGGAGGGAARELSPYMELVWVRQFPCSCRGDEGPWGPAAARGVAGSPHACCLQDRL